MGVAGLKAPRSKNPRNARGGEGWVRVTPEARSTSTITPLILPIKEKGETR
jgi:hypothetical protein